MDSKSNKKGRIFRFICLIAYILCAIVLIVESCLNGKISAGQSDAVGGGLAEIFNGIGGDQTKAVEPEKLNIKNKIEEVYIGDIQEIQYEILPEEATYKAVSYVSSNENVATISNDGVISYISEGVTNIQVISEYDKTIKDSFKVKVSKVYPTSISLDINAKYSDNVYELSLYESYFLNWTIEPENTTNKDVTFSIDKDDYLSISDDGKITPIKYSNGEITTIKATINDISCEIKVKVNIDVVELESLSYTSIDQEVYPGQKVTPKVIYNPSDATFKDYMLSSSDDSIVQITSKSYKAIKPGKATITISSMSSKDIFVSFEVEVLESPIVENFKVSYNDKLLLDAKGKISISNVTPRYCDTSSIKYESLNPEVVSVDSKGNIEGLSIGKGTIKIYNEKNSFKEKLIEIEVIERSSNNDYTTGFDVTYLKGYNAVLINQEIDLKDYFAVSKFYYDNNIPTTDKNISYSVIYDNEEIKGSKVKFNKDGHYSVLLTHDASKITKVEEIIVIEDFNVYLSNKSIKVGKSMEFSIDSKANIHQNFIVTIDNNEIATLFDENNTYTIEGKDEGVINISIIPVYDGISYKQLSKTYQLKIDHIYSSLNHIDVENTNGEINDGNIIYMSDEYRLIVTADETATTFNVEYYSSDESVLTIDREGKITTYKPGEAKVKVLNVDSKSSVEIDFVVKNKINVDKDNPILLTGEKVDVDNGKYSIKNGYSANISMNFDSLTTYKQITYKTSDESILSVNEDGTLTPHKEGKAIITMICDDGNGERKEISVTIHVKRQELITDLSAFFYKVRKAIGHFGAFLVLGIFSTFTYMLYLKNKKWIFSIPINFVAGFLLALLTEIIQTYIPGRHGSFNDVLIDYSGFISSSIILTIGILVYYYIKHINTYKK